MDRFRVVSAEVCISYVRGCIRYLTNEVRIEENAVYYSNIPDIELDWKRLSREQSCREQSPSLERRSRLEISF
jgi:hypothetical protein